jgi:hypothetical protein
MDIDDEVEYTATTRLNDSDDEVDWTATARLNRQRRRG